MLEGSREKEDLAVLGLEAFHPTGFIKMDRSADVLPLLVSIVHIVGPAHCSHVKMTPSLRPIRADDRPHRKNPKWRIHHARDSLFDEIAKRPKNLLLMQVVGRVPGVLQPKKCDLIRMKSMIIPRLRPPYEQRIQLGIQSGMIRVDKWAHFPPIENDSLRGPQIC